jgi:hypothetical protein
MDLFRKPPGVVSRWISFENPTAARSAGAQKNRGAKGRPSEIVKPGQSVTLVDTSGPGVLRRIWMTTSEHQSPRTMRSLRIEMFWDGANKPAVAAPLNDFFGMGLGRKTAFESALFADPEGRSFNCFAPMPFRKNAKMVVTNESEKDIMIFYEVDLTLGDDLGSDALYFHAHWRRENPTALGREFEILPKVKGAGRFLGANVGLVEDPAYHGGWFGEGEVKIYLDGDGEHPTLAGTGTEDWIGTAWGQKKFAQRTTGCPIHDLDTKSWCFYRYHVDDPVFFDSDCRVTLQNMGGIGGAKLKDLVARGAKLEIVTVATPQGLVNFLEKDEKVTTDDPRIGEFWTNFWRQDDLSATAYFYLDRPTSELPLLQSLAERIADVPNSI